jgi:hypothetical protein
MDQHTWVRGCLAYYKENDLTPEPGGEWQEAHYPAPKGIGTEVIWLKKDHHQVQGILQSEEYGRQCFFNSDVLAFFHSGSFVPDWFDLHDVYHKWAKINGLSSLKRMNDHPNTIRGKAEGGKTSGPGAAKTMNNHPNTHKNREDIGKRLSKPVLCVGTGVIYPSTIEAERKTGIPHSNIIKCCSGERKSAGGYQWKYTTT